MTPLTCWRPVAATLSNQNGAGFGSLPAQSTLTDSTESCGGAFSQSLRRSLKRPPSNSVFCRAAKPGVSQRCKKNILCRQRQQTALKKSNKARAATQCMVSGTVFATDVTSQPLRLSPYAKKDLKLVLPLWLLSPCQALKPARLQALHLA